MNTTIFKWAGVTALVLAIIALISVVSLKNSLPEMIQTAVNGTSQAFGNIATNITNFSSSLQTKGELTTNTSVGGSEGGTEGWLNLSIAAGTNQTCKQISTTATTNATSRVDFADAGITFGEKASSSIQMYVIATTSASLPSSYDFSMSNPEPASSTVLSRFGFATSTVGATSTDRIIQSAKGPALSEVLVPVNSYVCSFVQQDTTNCKGKVGVCENSTSTIRGFNPFVGLHYHR